MKLWISGRIDHEIDDEFFRKVLNETEEEINKIISTKNYGTSIESWDVIMVIYKNQEKNFFKYNAREKETDIEISINYDEFKKGNLKIGKQLFFDALILSLNKLKENKKIVDFEFDRLIADIEKLK